MKRIWGISIFIFCLLCTGAGSARAAPAAKGLKADEVVSVDVCRADRARCLCPAGLAPKTFIASRGGRFIQCVKTRCPAGKLLRQSYSPGGRPQFSCESVVERNYSEPTIKAPAKKGFLPSFGKKGG